MKKSVFDLKHQNKSVDSKIITGLERVSQAFRVLLWNESKEFSLSPIQVQTLIFLLYHSEEKRKISYLAKEFNMTKATISDMVKVLEKKGLISKEIGQHDTRSFIIHLTENGSKLAKQTSSFTQEIKTPIDKLSIQEKETLLLSLINIIHHLNKTGIITIQRMCFTCVYYSKNTQGHEHFCRLLDKKLETKELRVDCPEHLQQE
ncbi:MAG: MarR family transcriptional regulator [Chitinophagaceae bacterium]|nr:MAG: MarR family transcriptional regulator [Chitinophagaceae bacterium]